MKRLLTISLVILLIGSLSLAAQPETEQEEQPPTEDYKGAFDKILEFLYTIAHFIGQGIIELVQMIVPSATIPTDLVDPIGVLALLTAFLALAEIAKRITWIVVIAGWLLIGVRMAMVALNPPE